MRPCGHLAPRLRGRLLTRQVARDRRPHRLHQAFEYLDVLGLAEVERIASSGLATPIPLHLRYQAGGHRIVGTTTDYLDFRGLELAAGRRFAILGECVLGADAANEVDAISGATMTSDKVEDIEQRKQAAACAERQTAGEAQAHQDDNDGQRDLHWGLLDGVMTEASLRATFVALDQIGYSGAASLELSPALADPQAALVRSRQIVLDCVGEFLG